MNLSSSLSDRQIRAVALPPEHGSWGFLFEPLLLGLLVAGSPRGLLLATALLCAFLIHQPLKLALKDRLKGRRTPRSLLAERFALGYGLLALLLLGIVGITSDLHFLVPLLFALPLLFVQIWYDAHNQSRGLIAELCGTLALGGAAAAVAILGGWSFRAALALWLIVASRSIPSILYVRTRLRLEHGKPIRPDPVWIAHSAALLIILLAAVTNVIPAAVIGAFVLLLARALIGLSRWRKPRSAKQIGLMEIAYGLSVVAITAMSYAFG